MSFEVQYALSQNSTFIPKVHIAMANIAIAIGGELQSGKTWKQWQKRGDLSHAVLTDPNGWINQFAIAVASDESIDGTNDAAIQNRISAVWDKIAGVSGIDLLTGT